MPAAEREKTDRRKLSSYHRERVLFAQGKRHLQVRSSSAVIGLPIAGSNEQEKLEADVSVWSISNPKHNALIHNVLNFSKTRGILMRMEDAFFPG